MQCGCGRDLTGHEDIHDGLMKKGTKNMTSSVLSLNVNPEPRGTSSEGSTQTEPQQSPLHHEHLRHLLPEDPAALGGLEPTLGSCSHHTSTLR
jgi:hypothetical protein